MMHTREQPTVVVGVDGAVGSRAAIGLAAREAGYRNARLVAVKAYSASPPLGAPAGRPLSTLHTADDERMVAESDLRDAVVSALGDQAGEVELRIVAGLAGRNLAEEARDIGAQLIVLAA